ncbi:MAG: energy-coupling factor transporter transmembrane protein EcfT, partial [Clostridia bacterium]|nr:energy-coupling factor transporter transmembrane protein EcfT [Clostridia bacterium]
DKNLDIAVLDCTMGDYDGDWRVGEHNSIGMLRVLIPSLKSVKAIIFIVIIMAIINLFTVREGTVLWSWWKIIITLEGVFTAVKLALRLIFLVMGTALLTYITTPMALTDGMESLMYPLSLIKVPTHDIAIIMSIALRFIPILMEEVDKIMMAQKARGACFDRGGLLQRAKALLPVLIPLFVSAFRRADELALALDARCYNATPNRTKYKQAKFTWRDLIASIFTAIFIALVVAINNNFWGLY